MVPASLARLGANVGTKTIRPRRLTLLLGALPSLYWSLPAATQAGELDLTAGGEQSSPDAGRTYTWGIEYRQPFSAHLSASLTWLNEGHLTNHHRDGQALQLWWRSTQTGPGLVFEAGAGPYHYYDTTDAAAVNTPTGVQLEFEDAHGWGVLASIALDWYFRHGWFAMLRVNDIEAAGRVRSTALTAGVGYRFGDGAYSSFRWRDAWFAADAPRSEVDGLVGRVVLNSFHSEGTTAQALSLRTNLSRHFVASLTYTVAQNIPLDWRSGTALQLWAETPLTGSLTVGVGAGAFINSDRANSAARAATTPAGILGITAAYSLGSRWTVRALWNRVATRDDDDSDIVLIGLGYRF